MTTAPTTLAGAAALARYMAEVGARDICSEGDLEAALATLAEALPALAGEAAHV